MWYVATSSRGILAERTHFREARKDALKMFASESVPQRLQSGFYIYRPKADENQETLYIFHDTLTEELGYGEKVRQWTLLNLARRHLGTTQMMKTGR